MPPMSKNASSSEVKADKKGGKDDKKGGKDDKKGGKDDKKGKKEKKEKEPKLSKADIIRQKNEIKKIEGI